MCIIAHLVKILVLHCFVMGQGSTMPHSKQMEDKSLPGGVPGGGNFKPPPPPQIGQIYLGHLTTSDCPETSGLFLNMS